MLRSKPKMVNGELIYDHNSYKSPDEVNNLRWNELDGTSLESQMVAYYAGLCAIRTKMNIFTDHTANFSVYKHNDNAGFNIIIRDNKGGVAVIVFNPETTAKNFTLPSGDFHMIGDGTVAGIASLGVVNGQISVPGYSAKIFVNAQVLNSVGK